MATDKQKHIRIVRPDNTYKDKDFRFRLGDINLGTEEQSRLINEHDNFINSDLETSLHKRTSIQYINVTEFEPDMFFRMTQHLKLIISTLDLTNTAVQKALGAAEKFIDTFYKNKGKYNKKKAPDDSTTSLALNYFLDEDNNNTYADQVLTRPLKIYRSFFNGKYVRSYQIPQNDDLFFSTDGTSGWNTNSDSMEMGFTGYMETIWKTLNNANIVSLPPIPRWNHKSEDTDFFGVDTTFNLVNNNLENLTKNFKFLINLVQGPFWIQNNTRQYPPNVYSVEIPGTVFIQYAAMGVNVSTKGNKRKPPLKFFQNLTPNIFGTNFTEYKDKHDILLPDAWEVTVSFKSLVPNNFNNYLNYLLNPSQSEVITGNTFEDGILKS